MKNNLRYSSSIDWENGFGSIDKSSVSADCRSKKDRIKSFNADHSVSRKGLSRFTGIKMANKIPTGENFTNIDFKSNLKTGFGKSFSFSSVYFGLLFVFIFGFLFFLAVSISYASTNTMKEFDEDVFYNKESGEKLLAEYLFDSTKKDEKKGNIKNRTEKLILKEYTSVKGDSAESISKKFGISSETIYLTNFIKKRIRFSEGTKLSIPNMEGRMIVVQKNDSLFRISDRYAVKWERIVDANNLQSSIIKPGAKIFIPDSKMTKYEKEAFTDKFFIHPIKGIITSGYGLRKDPITGVLDFHTGIDIKNDKGKPVKSVRSGKVVFTGWQKVYGNFVMIKHDREIITIYGHLDSIEVQKDQRVAQGELIGKVGDSGRTTGPHLHFEVRRAGKIVNPKDYF